MKIFQLALVALFCLSPSVKAESSQKSPDVSGDALFLYRNSNFAKENKSLVRNGFDVHEAELAFFSEVDSHSKLNLRLSVHKEYLLDTTTQTVGQKWKIEPEEVYAETDHIPFSTLKIGKFKAAFGKHNELHTHSFPFVDAPIVNTALLGDEGLNDVGLSAAVLLPFSWYSEITGQYLRGEGENTQFNSPSPGNALGVGHWKNLWNLSESLTLELGASYATGGNSLGGDTTLSGADLAFKWRPASGGKVHSWILATEFIDRKQEQPTSKTENAAGWNLWGQFQFSEHWAILARYDHLKVEGSDGTVNPHALANIYTDKYSSALVFHVSEFSSYRLEYNHAVGPLSTSGETTERKIYLQAHFMIGAHHPHEE